MLSRKTNIRVDELLQTLYDAFDWVVRSIARQVGRRLKKAAPRRAENIKNCQAAIHQSNQYVLSKDDEGNYEVEKKSDGTIYFVRDNFGCLCFQDVSIFFSNLQFLKQHFRKIVIAYVGRVPTVSRALVCTN